MTSRSFLSAAEISNRRRSASLPPPMLMAVLASADAADAADAARAQAARAPPQQHSAAALLTANSSTTTTNVHNNNNNRVRAPSGAAPSPSASQLTTRRRRQKHSNEMPLHSHSASNHVGGGVGSGHNSSAGTPLSGSPPRAGSAADERSGGAGQGGQGGGQKVKRKKGSSHHAAPSSSAPLSQSDVDFFHSLSMGGDVEPGAVSMLSQSDKLAFKAVREYREKEIADGRLSVHIAGVDGVWPVAGGAIGGMAVPPRPETVRIQVQVHAVSALAAAPAFDAARQLSATVRLVTNDASLLPEWTSASSGRFAGGLAESSKQASLSTSPASLVGDADPADAAGGGSSVGPGSVASTADAVAAAATSLSAVRPPREDGALVSTTATLIVKSAIEEVSITVLEANSGALLGQLNVPVADLRLLQEKQLRVALGTRLNSRSDKPLRSHSHGGASGTGRRPRPEDLRGGDDDDDSETREQPPSLVVSLLPLNFGHRRGSIIYEPAFSGSELNAPVVLEGLLDRRIGRRWRERYVRLDEENLYIYKAADDRERPEILPLALASVKETTSSSAEKKATHAYRFEIWTNHERHEFCTNSVQAIKRWMAALEGVCAALLTRHLDEAAAHPVSPSSERTILDCVILEARDLGSNDAWSHPPSSQQASSSTTPSAAASAATAAAAGGATGAVTTTSGGAPVLALSGLAAAAAAAQARSGDASKAVLRADGSSNALGAGAGNNNKRSGGSGFSTSADVPPVAPPIVLPPQSNSGRAAAAAGVLRSPQRRVVVADVYAVITCCGQHCRTAPAPSLNPQWSRGDGSERDQTLGTSVNCSFVIPSERPARLVVRIELFDDVTHASYGATQVAIGDVQADEARWSDGIWLPLYASGASTANGVVRVRLQVNSRHTGMLARYGYPLGTMPLRAHSGDLVLFTPDSTGARVVRLMTACKWVHVGMVVMGHNDKLKLLEATAAGVTLRLLDAQLVAYHRAGSVVGLRRLCGVARSASLIDSLIEFVDRVEGTPYETKYTQMLKAQKRSNKEVDLDAVFCSELVAAAFMHLGLLSARDMSASNFMPKDFATEMVFAAANGSAPALAAIVECRENGSCTYGGVHERQRSMSSPRGLPSPRVLAAASPRGPLSPRTLSPMASPGRDDSDESTASNASGGRASSAGHVAATGAGAEAVRRVPDIHQALLRSGSGKVRKILLQGSLDVKLSRNRWRSRWLKLTSDHLFVYKTAASRGPALDVFPLTFASVKETTTSGLAGKANRYQFELYSGLRHELFATDNVHLLKQWTSGIQACCDRLLQAQLERLEISKPTAAPARPDQLLYASAVQADDSDDLSSSSGGDGDDDEHDDDDDDEHDDEEGDDDSQSTDSIEAMPQPTISVEAPKERSAAVRARTPVGGSADDDDSASASTMPLPRPVRRVSGLLASTEFASARSSEKFPSGSSERAGERYPSMTSLFNEGSSTDSTDAAASVEARIMRAHREEIRKSSALLDAELKLLDVTINNSSQTSYLSELDALLRQKLQSVEELRDMIARAAAAANAAAAQQQPPSDQQ